MSGVVGRPGMTCSRCEQQTNNNSQGHYWKFCNVTGTFREFHFCCPGDCELEANANPPATTLADTGNLIVRVPKEES